MATQRFRVECGSSGETRSWPERSGKTNKPRKSCCPFWRYHSAVTETASLVAERLKIPFFNAESSSPKLTRRGFKWFFRSSPHDEIFAGSLFECLIGLKKRGMKIKTVGIMYEDTLYGKEAPLKRHYQKRSDTKSLPIFLTEELLQLCFKRF